MSGRFVALAALRPPQPNHPPELDVVFSVQSPGGVIAYFSPRSSVRYVGPGMVAFVCPVAWYLFHTPSARVSSVVADVPRPRQSFRTTASARCHHRSRTAAVWKRRSCLFPAARTSRGWRCGAASASTTWSSAPPCCNGPSCCTATPVTASRRCTAGVTSKSRCACGSLVTRAVVVANRTPCYCFSLSVSHNSVRVSLFCTPVHLLASTAGPIAASVASWSCAALAR